MTAPLLSLPQDVLCSIANYLLPEPEQNKRIFHYSYDWRNFLNSNKEYFGKWKKESQILVLGDSDARRFRDLKEFRERIYQCIENPRFQLDVVFDEREKDRRSVIDLQLFENVRKIHSKYYDCVAPPVINADDIFLVDYRIQDLSFCSNIKSVTFVQSPEALEGIFDFSVFQNIEKGIFGLGSLYSTTNHHLLSNLKSLVLCRCSAITDVSCFQNIPHLTLNWCSGITDVSCLGRVHTLNLMGCSNIRDVSALGRVHTLDLSYCDNATDLSALEWVYSLTLGDEFLGTDLSGLTNIVILNIRGASSVTDITMLQSLQVLNITGCRGITSLSGLTRLKELWIYESHIRRITSGNEVFPRLTTLHLLGGYNPPCSQFLQTLDRLQELSLQSYVWNDSSCISFLPGLCSLTLSYCGGFTVLPQLPPPLGYLKILRLSGKQESLTIPRRVGSSFPLYDLIIEDCYHLKKVQINENVFRFKIFRCVQLTNIVVTEQIGHLTLGNVEYLEKIVNWSKIVCPALFFRKERVLTVDPEKDELRVGLWEALEENYVKKKQFLWLIFSRPRMN
jgi:hypothetical protein